MEMVHVISGTGKHRLQAGENKGELVSYSQIAKLTLSSRTFAATTEYWAGTLPTFFEITEATVKEEYVPDGLAEEKESERAWKSRLAEANPPMSTGGSQTAYEAHEERRVYKMGGN